MYLSEKQIFNSNPEKAEKQNPDFTGQMDMFGTSFKKFETLNWLSLTERFTQCVSPTAFKYVNDQCPNYLNQVL